jgi:phosphoglycerate dehydrogenase-like enzyme
VRVAILDDTHDVFATSNAVKRLRERAEEVRIFTEPFGEPGVLRGYDAVIANRERTRFDRVLLEQLPDLRIIAQTGNHANHVDVAAAAELGIVVGKATGGGFSIGTAELAIGLMIAVMRGIPRGDAALRRGIWPSPVGPVLHGKVLGVVGFGRQGQYVSRLANAFGMRVLAWSPSLTPERARAHGTEWRDIDTLLSEADVVTLHVALNVESRGLITAERLMLMKGSAFLINTSRGPIVDEAALVETLRSRRIAGAGLDVFDTEPLPSRHPLTDLENVVLTPHIGWVTDHAYTLFSEAAADVLLAWLDGRPFERFEPHTRWRGRLLEDGPHAFIASHNTRWPTS